MGKKIPLWGVKVLGFALATLTLFSFQNCSSQFQVLEEQIQNLASGAPDNGTTPLIQEEQKSLVILSQNCKACHQDQALGNIQNILNVQHLITSGLVRPGQPETSPLMIAINQNRMPPGNPMTSADKNVLTNWIRLLGNQAPVDPTPVDMTFNMSVSVDPLPFRVRYLKVGYVMGSTASPTLSKLDENKIFLGEYDFSRGVAPKFSWEPSDMKAWLEGLEPVCGSTAFRNRYPFPTGNASFIQNTFGRGPSSEDQAVIAEINALSVSNTEKSDILCFTMLSSLEFISK